MAASIPDKLEGLTSEEARRRLQAVGPNTAVDKAVPFWGRAVGKVWGPVPWMLEAAVVLQLALGERLEAAVVGFLLLFNAAMGLVQEGRAQATLDALKSKLALTAQARRDGAWATVPAAELVPGDLVKLSLGTVVAADVRLRQGEVLLDHSMLTGESLPFEGGPGQDTYAGALVRRGEAIGEVTATGPRTRFGRTAELVRTAHATSSQERAVMRVVRNLAIFNACVVLAQGIYGVRLGMRLPELAPLVLTAVLAAIPVTLPATFTLAAALGARALARKGVLPTRLAAVDEAASIDVLCADKTGTLTRNELTVAEVVPAPGVDQARVLGLAALASSDGGADPVDHAVRAAALATPTRNELPRLVTFTPFDPAAKMSEAVCTDASGAPVRVLKGAFSRISLLAADDGGLARSAEALAREGYRILAVAAGAPDALRLTGLLALSDPPRPDAGPLVAQLREMGVRTVMVTGDAPATAEVVARAVGLEGAVWTPGGALGELQPDRYAVFAGVLPEDKHRIVRAFQAEGRGVGMCGDGVNDAPALRQAQMGVAVSTATDVAKSAAGLVLTEAGLSGVLAAVREGRVAFQRILTYLLRSMTQKIDQMLFLTAGLVMTGHAVLSPMLMALILITGDVLAMSSTTDRVRPSPRPNSWRIGALTGAGVIMGVSNLLFCSGLLAIGAFILRLPPGALQTFAAVILVFSGQAVFYVVRERRRIWSSRPSPWVMLSSAADIGIISTLALNGVLMDRLPAEVLAGVFLAAVAFAFLLDEIKSLAFSRLRLT